MRRVAIVLWGLAGCAEPQAPSDGPADTTDRGSDATTDPRLPPTGDTGGDGTTGTFTTGGRVPPPDVDVGGDEVEPYFEGPEVVGLHHVEHYLVTPGQGFFDFDGDGSLDIVITDQQGPNRLLRNNGGTFEEVDVGQDFAKSELASAGIAAADYDNDGWIDLYVAAFGPNVLMRNLEGAGFEDVTQQAGVGDAGVGESAAWADFDADGLLDLYVVNNNVIVPDRLYRNLGDGTFADVSSWLGIPEMSRPGFAASFFDYDLDGDCDLYVVNDKQLGNVLWRNDGPGCGGWCFTDVSESSGAGVAMYSMGLAVGDYDADGDLDVYVTNLDDMVLLRNAAAEGDPVFEDVADEAGVRIGGVDGSTVGWGTAFIDYDLDGWLDLYVGLGRMDEGSVNEDRLFRNLGDGTFEDVSDAGGVADPGVTMGVAHGDIDGDGREDLLLGQPDGGFHLYRNRGTAGAGHGFVTISVVGTGAVPPDAVGTQVGLHTDDGRSLLRVAPRGSGLGASDDPRLHFGLETSGIGHVTVRWPDGLVEQYDAISRGAEVTLVHP